MNDAQHAVLSGYIRDLADAMGLRDWSISLGRYISDTGEYRAQITLHRQKDEAEVELSEAWFGRTPEEQRQTVVHELLHIHTARLCRTLTRFTEQVGGELATYLAKEHDEEEEIVIERLARVLAPYLPLPPEEKTNA